MTAVRGNGCKAVARWGMTLALLASTGLALPVVTLAQEPPPASVDDALPTCPAQDWSDYPPNPAGDRDRRLATIQAWKQDTAAMDPHRMLVLGSLYRLGCQHPAGSLVSRDLTLARRYLSNAALAGQLLAMPGMAELELAHGDALAAMVWAQAYVHFHRLQWKEEPNTYVADLVRRVYGKLPAGDATAQEVAETFAGFMENYGQRIGDAIAAAPASTAEESCRPTADDWPAIRESAKRERLVQTRDSRAMTGPGQTYFRLRINPAGEVVQAIVLESLPDARAGEGLMGTAMRMRFNALDAGAPERQVLVPLALDDGSVRLRD